METIHRFATTQEARDYRHAHGIGGWIFEPDDGSAVTLFPPSIYPAAIFHHPLTRGQSGRLIGSQ